MRRWIGMMGVCGLLMGATEAEAATRALIYTGNSGYTGYAYTNLSNGLRSGGAAGVDVTTSWPASMANYVVVFLMMPAAALSAAQVTDLQNLVADGGLVVLVGDNSGFSAANAVLNTTASNLGVSLRLVNAAYDAGCAYPGRVASAASPFMSGVNSLYYAYVSNVTLGANSTGLIQRQSGNEYVIAYENSVVMTGDVNVFDGCSTYAGNTAFYQNLWNRWCDYDNDGVDREICGGTDCDDFDAAVTASGTYYRDSDGDGYGNPNSSQSGCTNPNGYVTDSTDCNDNSALAYPNRPEACDGIDNDCDGAIDEGVGTNTWYIDSDGDGFGNAASSVTNCNTSAPVGYATTSTDCNDSVAAINPSARETCDGVDQDCDGSIDENATNATTYYQDADGDNYGNRTATQDACSRPSGYVTTFNDCDDTRSNVYPSAPEYCDGIDNDCDRQIDESAVDATRWYRDADNDTYGNPSLSQSSCSQPLGYVSDSTDCNDSSATINAGASEYCNGLDDDCDGAVDDAAIDGTTWYLDADSDGYGDLSRTSLSCVAPSGYVSDDTDCNDHSSAVNPAANEVCNGIDDDCDGTIDGITATDIGTWYADSDGDGYGNANVTTEECSQPPGYVGSPDDCDDTNFDISPSALELCNLIDDNCNGTVDEGAAGAGTWYADTDNDGFGDINNTTDACDQPQGYTDDTTDCNDLDAATYPGAAEVPYDTVDQDCDGADLIDVDGDTYVGLPAGGTDCLDTDATVYPGAAELADGVDSNCDGLVDNNTDSSDDDGDGWTESGGDCDDLDSGINPGATEVANTVDDDCDGLIDEGTALYDDDGDGQSESQGDCNDGDPSVSTTATEILGNGVDDDCDGLIDGGETDTDSDGYTAAGGDCATMDGTVYPGAPELMDGIDNDCDGLVDEGTDSVDDDGDGQTESDGDCDDNDASIHTGASEIPNGIDDDCDGTVDEGTMISDDDGDGFTEQGGDCDDNDPAAYPGAEEIPDGRDNDCDGQVDEGTSDLDADGFSVADGDCDDATGWANPSVQEVCDSIDNNCDGVVDEGCDGTEDSSVVTDPPKDPSCGCATGTPSAAFGVGLAALTLIRRRKRA